MKCGFSTIFTTRADVYKRQVPASRITELLGVDVPEETMADILCRLSIQTTLQDHILTCRVPSFRDDVEGRADLALSLIHI